MANEPIAKILKFQDVESVLAQLANASNITTTNWPLQKILFHCGQTIKYSMIGYLTLKPWLFRQTIGRLVLRGFLKKGVMHHDLQAPVPGSPDFPVFGSEQDEITAFLKTIKEFQGYSGPFHPHLAFGVLTKEEYEAYFALHFADHLTEIHWTSVI